MKLHKCLKFGTLVVLFDPLKVLFNWMFYRLSSFKGFLMHFYRETIQIHLLLWPFPKLVGSPNSVLYLITVIIDCLIEWNKAISDVYFLAFFKDPAQRVHTIVSCIGCIIVLIKSMKLSGTNAISNSSLTYPILYMMMLETDVFRILRPQQVKL